MDEQEDLIAQFCGIADTTAERARFYLESAQWQLPVALSSFYDNPSAGTTERDDEMDVEYRPPQEDLSHPAPVQELSAQTGGRTTRSKKPTQTSKFGSIRDFNNEDDNSSEEEGQRFYAGGSEHSGELIVGPPRKKHSNEEIAKSLFSEAKKHGAQSVEPDPERAGKSGDSASKHFSGGGYKLGESSEASEFIPSQEAPPERGPVNVMLRLWTNGFTVDDGPLRDYHDPENSEFLNNIKRGEIPRELIREAKGGEVHVDMEDRRQEEYKAPKKKLTPFTGQGHMLGSPTPSFTSTSSIGGAAPLEKKSSSVDPPLLVDDSKPKTTLQIRLSDGKRIRKEFNQSHSSPFNGNFTLSISVTGPASMVQSFYKKAMRNCQDKDCKEAFSIRG